MKLAFYIDSLHGDEYTINLFNQLNAAVEKGVVEDACLFYNKVNFNPVIPKFGVFNATDIWHFSGVLVATTVLGVLSARNMINKFDLYYLFDRDRDFVGLLKIGDVPILVRTEDDEKYIRRVLGVTPIRVPEDLNVEGVLQAL
jgi:hypothetical protein